MHFNRIHAVYFSPTGCTRKSVGAIAGALAGLLQTELVTCDLTPPTARQRQYRFAADELVICGLPVYAGRLPNKLLPFLQQGLCGENATVVPVVLYGNRNYDMALAELTALLQQQGFCPVAAAALIGEHSFTSALAGGRPDDADFAALQDFSRTLSSRLRMAQSPPPAVEVPGGPADHYYVPRRTDGAPAIFLKAKPITDAQRCTRCGTCARLCPMGSISHLDPTAVPGLCIKCHACIRSCPQQAKHFEDPDFISHRAMLQAHYTARRKPDFFFAD